MIEIHKIQPKMAHHVIAFAVIGYKIKRDDLFQTTTKTETIKYDHSKCPGNDATKKYCGDCGRYNVHTITTTETPPLPGVIVDDLGQPISFHEFEIDGPFRWHDRYSDGYICLHQAETCIDDRDHIKDTIKIDLVALEAVRVKLEMYMKEVDLISKSEFGMFAYCVYS